MKANDALLEEVMAEPTVGPQQRRSTRQVRVGNVTIGSNAPIVVQSMTNTAFVFLPQVASIAFPASLAF